MTFMLLIFDHHHLLHRRMILNHRHLLKMNLRQMIRHLMNYHRYMMIRHLKRNGNRRYCLNPMACTQMMSRCFVMGLNTGGCFLRVKQIFAVHC